MVVTSTSKVTNFCPLLPGTLRPSVKSETITESENVKKWLDNYLWVGEVVMDQSVALMSSSGYFERKR
ncbi:hypothetical protein SLS57_011458 [Botryosphaeria dothidea]